MYRTVGIIYLLTVILCAGIILAGHSSAEPDFIPDVERCGNTFCYLGIEAGVTVWQDALTILLNTQLSKDLNYRIQWRYQAPQLIYKLEMGTNIDGNVEEISFRIDQSDITAGDIVARFGPPCEVSAFPYVVILRYEHMTFFFGSNGPLLQYNTPLNAFYLLSVQRSICKANLDYGYWRGFGAYPLSEEG